MEHSYLGDLSVFLISPSGQIITIKSYPGGGSANLGIPWATASVDGSSSNTTPGIGHQYCFVPGGAFPTLVGGVVTGGVFPSGNGPGTYTDSYVPAGNYSSQQSFAGLLGTPLNGIWTIRVIDNLGLDNGYIFSWTMDFDPLLLPADYSFTPVIVSEGWQPNADITNTVANVITVQPTTSGSHCYTYSATDDFGCTYTHNVCLNVNPLPVVNIPPDISLCDNLDDGDNQNGFVQTFMLSGQTPTILGGQTGMTVTYYDNLADAEAETVAAQLSSPFTNTIAYNQTIFFRIENNATQCYDTGSFDILVTDIPAITNPGDQTYCDNYPQSPDFDATNGIINGLNFNSFNIGIIGAQTGMAVTYYESQAEAEAGMPAIVFPYQNITAFSQPIFIRLEQITSGCFSVGTFNLIVNPLPGILNDANTDGNVFNDFAVTEYGLCDDAVIDGRTQFNLLSKELEILNGETGMIVNYFTTQAACLSNSFALNPALPYINSTNPQTIYVRVENPTTGCLDYTQFQLRVYANPIANDPADMEVCDDDADGLMPFDLYT